MLGSASPSALRQASESLVGRLEILELGGLGIADVGVERFDDLWLRGGFPRSFLAPDNETSTNWRSNYIRTLATRDLPEFGVNLPAATIERFLALVAHAHGQLWNSAEPAHALGIADRASLLRNPRVGATWEGAVIEKCIRQMGETMTPYFWRTSNGAELDLLLDRLTVYYPGRGRYARSEQIDVVPAAKLDVPGNRRR